MTLLRLDYLVYFLDNRVDDTPTETNLKAKVSSRRCDYQSQSQSLPPLTKKTCRTSDRLQEMNPRYANASNKFIFLAN